MAKHKHLSNPPIKEVSVGLFFEEPVPLDLYTVVLNKYKGLDYLVNERKVVNFDLTDGIKTPSIVKDGSLIHSQNEEFDIHLDRKGVIFTFKKKYSSWETTYSEIQNFVRYIGVSELEDRQIKIMSVKFLNRFDFDAIDFDDFISHVLFKPSYFHGSSSPRSYITHIQDKPEDGITTNLISNLKLCGNNDKLYHLDTQISVIKETSLLLNQFSDTSHFSILRRIKNELFFNCFDDELIKRYE